MILLLSSRYVISGVVFWTFASPGVSFLNSLGCDSVGIFFLLVEITIDAITTITIIILISIIKVENPLLFDNFLSIYIYITVNFF